MGNWRHRFSRKKSVGTPVNGVPNKFKDNADASTPSPPPSADTSDRKWPQKAADTLGGLPQANNQLSMTSAQDTCHEQQHGGTQMGGSSKEKKDYWQIAVQQLQERDAHMAEQIKAIQCAAVSGGDTDLITQLVTATEESQKALEAKRWKIVVGSKEIVVRKQFDRIVKYVSLFQDIGGAAASLDPLHAGIPLAGLCLLMQVAVNDSEQYAAMLAGVDEIATVMARNQEIEKLYRLRSKTRLKQEFEKRLISLYKHIVRYHIAAAGYYRYNTLVRILRSFPKCDDMSAVLADIRCDDLACKDIGQVFDSSDARDRDEELLNRFDQLQQYMAGQHTQSTTTVKNPVHWVVSRSPNKLFTGRNDLLSDLQSTVQDALSNHARQSQMRIVITGMGGLGKSELCLQLAHQLQSSLWGIFWIDISTDTLAAAGYEAVAKKVGIPAQTWEEARQGVANLQKPWLLVLDNADDPLIDYERYFPPGTSGVVLLTSRNAECERHATTKHIPLEALSEAAARALLLDAAMMRHEERENLKQEAAAVASLLRSHPLAIIQAGAYVSRKHCTLAEYPAVYERQRQRLLAFRPIQARSRYGDVYATFEASATALQSSDTEAAKDALELLPLLAAYGTSRLPLLLFEAAWTGSQAVARSDEDGDKIIALTQWHTSHLPSFIQAKSAAWNSFRVVEAIQLLKALSLVSIDHGAGGDISMSMHPLIYAWARDRQSEAVQHDSWLKAGCIVAIASCSDNTWWRQPRQLQPHLQALTSWNTQVMFASEPAAKVTCILIRCMRLLNKLRDDRTVFKLMQRLSVHLGLSLSKVDHAWLPLYDVVAQNYYNYGEIKQAVTVLEQVVSIRKKTLEETHPDRLVSQQELAGAYQANGQVRQAVTLLEEVVKIKEKTLEETHLSRLISQHELAGAYIANGQVKQAVTLLEKVVKIEETTLEETHPSRLASQHALAGAYIANGQVKQAVTLLEKVVNIKETTLEETHPDRLVSQHALAGAYIANGQVKQAVTLLEKVVKIEETTLEETHPDRLASQHALAGAYIANGQVKQAVTLLEKVVKIIETTLEETHPDRLASQHALAGAYIANGQVKQAVTLLEQVVKIEETTLEETHPSRLTSQHELATAYIANGQVEQAVTLLEQVVSIWKKTLTETHPKKLASQHALAGAYEASGQLKQAVMLLEEVVNIRKKTLEETHPHRLVSQLNLATYYWRLDNHQEAYKLMKYVVEVYRRAFDGNHPDRRTAEEWLEDFEKKLVEKPLT